MSFRSVIHNEASALEFLFHRINYERTATIPYRGGEFKLDRMRELMRLLGNPQLNLPVVHVAGTKGKGSTASMIAASLQAAGYNTGLYTSPHLERLEERYVFNGLEITSDELVTLLQRIEPAVHQLDNSRADDSLRGPTFFELTTALAFLYFLQRGADLAVLEVGLGGRLDSTNVCCPIVCAITSISFDHMKQLGNTLAAIAREKAGIIKPGIPVISGVLPEEPRVQIEQVARDVNAPLIQRDLHFTAIPGEDQTWSRGPVFDYCEPQQDVRLAQLRCGLRGEHQRENAAVAVAVLRELSTHGFPVSEAAIRTGLAEVKCAARLELLRNEPPLLLDTAHNVASIEALCLALERNFPVRPRTLIFATSRDKDAPTILQRLLPLFDHVVLTKYVNNPRARTVEELLEIIASLPSTPRCNVLCCENPHQAWQQAQQVAGTGLICITGSFFLAAEMRTILQASPTFQGSENNTF